jgi:hypothetical protein
VIPVRNAARLKALVSVSAVPVVAMLRRRHGVEAKAAASASPRELVVWRHRPLGRYEHEHQVS